MGCCVKKDFKCAIFDLDGTILDSTMIWEEVDRDFLEKRGIPLTQEFKDEIKIHNFETGSEYVVRKYGLSETPKQVRDEWFGMVKNLYDNEVVLKSHAKEYLQLLKSRGVILAVATASDSLLFENCLKRNGIYDFFHSFTQASEVQRGKKFPDIYLRAAEKSCVEAADCVVFEDVLPAVRAAVSGGFYTVAVADRASMEDWDEMRLESNYFLYDYMEIMT